LFVISVLFLYLLIEKPQAYVGSITSTSSKGYQTWGTEERFIASRNFSSFKDSNRLPVNFKEKVAK
jgi:hypothetical protein